MRRLDENEYNEGEIKLELNFNLVLILNFEPLLIKCLKPQLIIFKLFIMHILQRCCDIPDLIEEDKVRNLYKSNNLTLCVSLIPNFLSFLSKISPIGFT